MKHILTLLFLLILASCSKSITGIALTGNPQVEKVYISLDTVAKYFESFSGDNHKKFNSDKAHRFTARYSTKTDTRGKFTIRVKPSDTLKLSADGYYTQFHTASDLLKKEKVFLKMEKVPCNTPAVNCDDATLKLHIVIAEKIRLTRLDNEKCKGVWAFDAKYAAKYRILENLYGDYKNSIINFTVYDHNGIPQFSDYDTVLLYISEHCGKFVHVKYQFSDLYKTNDGRWASPLSPSDYGHLKPEGISNYTRITFENPIKCSLETGWPTPKEYFETDDINTYPLYGRYVEDIIIQMKETKLKQFGFSF